jgi:hypothetical protein
MIIASVFGAAAGIYYSSTLNFVNNYLVFVALLALIGIGVANLVLLVLWEVNNWLKSSSQIEPKQITQTV